MSILSVLADVESADTVADARLGLLSYADWLDENGDLYGHRIRGLVASGFDEIDNWQDPEELAWLQAFARHQLRHEELKERNQNEQS